MSQKRVKYGPSSQSSIATQSEATGVSRKRGTRAKRSNRLVSVPRGRGMPNFMRATLRWYGQTVLSTDTAGLGRVLFSATSLYNPEVGTAVHQPHYFDQYMALYDHYRVENCKLSYQIVFDPDSTHARTLSMFLDDDTTPSVANYWDAHEREGAVFTTIRNGDNGAARLTLSWNAKQQFGSKATNDSMIGTATSEPAETTTFVCGLQGKASVNYTIGVFMEFTAVFTELKTVASS